MNFITNLLIILILLLACSSNDVVQGGGTDVANGYITGSIILPDSSKSIYSDVILLPIDFNPINAIIPDSLVDISNENGIYKIGPVDSGSYNLYTISLNEKYSSFTRSIIINDSTVTINLKSDSIIRQQILLDKKHYNNNGILYLQGTPIFEDVPDNIDTISLYLPFASLPKLIYYSSTITDTLLDTLLPSLQLLNFMSPDTIIVNNKVSNPITITDTTICDTASYINVFSDTTHSIDTLYDTTFIDSLREKYSVSYIYDTLYKDTNYISDTIKGNQFVTSAIYDTMYIDSIFDIIIKSDTIITPTYNYDTLLIDTILYDTIYKDSILSDTTKNDTIITDATERSHLYTWSEVGYSFLGEIYFASSDSNGVVTFSNDSFFLMIPDADSVKVNGGATFTSNITDISSGPNSKTFISINDSALFWFEVSAEASIISQDNHQSSIDSVVQKGEVTSVNFYNNTIVTSTTNGISFGNYSTGPFTHIETGESIQYAIFHGTDKIIYSKSNNLFNYDISSNTTNSGIYGETFTGVTLVEILNTPNDYLYGITNALNNNSFYVFNPQGEKKTFQLDSYLNNSDNVSELTIDDDSNAWISTTNSKIICIKAEFLESSIGDTSPSEEDYFILDNSNSAIPNNIGYIWEIVTNKSGKLYLFSDIGIIVVKF